MFTLFSATIWLSLILFLIISSTSQYPTEDIGYKKEAPEHGLYIYLKYIGLQMTASNTRTDKSIFNPKLIKKHFTISLLAFGVWLQTLFLIIIVVRMNLAARAKIEIKRSKTMRQRALAENVIIK